MISATDYTWQIKRLKDRIETLEALVKQLESDIDLITLIWWDCMKNIERDKLMNNDT